MYKLSILILTHNRPLLFKRCVESILKHKKNFVEILVNNDTDDIEESSDYKLFHKKSDNLSDLYEFLFDSASGEYIYFLEDDDYITDDFFENIDFLSDLYYMNFVSHDIRLTLERRKNKFDLEKINDKFQLSQILFKKKFVTEFPFGNNLDNDWVLFNNILTNINQNNGIIRVIEKYMWVQTTDGKDNISFPKYNKDKRWING